MIYIKKAVETFCTRRAESKSLPKVYKTPKCLQRESTLRNIDAHPYT